MCPPGEFNETPWECLPCPDLTYSGWGYRGCVDCPADNGLNCANGTATPDPGFYCQSSGLPILVQRAVAGEDGYNPQEVLRDVNENPEGLQFVVSECLTPERCLGGVCCENPADCGACSEGFSGYLCARCETGYYKYNGDCLECPDLPPTSTLLIGAGVCAFLALLFFKMPRGGFVLSVGKVSLDFFQIAGLFPEFSITWGPWLSRVFGWFNVLNFDIEVIAPECTIGEMTYSMQTTFIIIGPAIVIAVFFLGAAVRKCFFCTRKCCCGKEENLLQSSTLVNIALKLFVTFFTLGYIALASRAMEVFDCRTVGDDQIWEPSPDLKCYDSNPPLGSAEPGHTDIIAYGAVGTLLYVFGLPMIFRRILLNNVDNLDNPTIRKRYGSLYAMYTKRAVAFESWVMLRKIGIVGAKLFLTAYPFEQAAIGTVVFSLSFLHHLWVRPHSNRILNRLELFFLAVQIVVMVNGVIITTQPPEAEIVRVFSLVATGAMACGMVGIAAAVYFQIKNARRQKLSVAPQEQAAGKGGKGGKMGVSPRAQVAPQGVVMVNGQMMVPVSPAHVATPPPMYIAGGAPPSPYGGGGYGQPQMQPHPQMAMQYGQMQVPMQPQQPVSPGGGLAPDRVAEAARAYAKSGGARRAK